MVLVNMMKVATPLTTPSVMAKTWPFMRHKSRQSFRLRAFMSSPFPCLSEHPFAPLLEKKSEQGPFYLSSDYCLPRGWEEKETDTLLRDVSALLLVRFCHMMPHTLSSKGKARTRVRPRAAFGRPMGGGTDDGFFVEL